MWWNNYIGIPFKWHGTDRNGCSCWGLVCLVAKEVYNKRLPRHDENESLTKSGGGSPVPYFASLYKIELDEAKEGDLLHMWSFSYGKKLPLHVGIITEKGKVLHIEEGLNSIIEDYTSKRCAWRVIGAYRIE